MPTDSPSQGGSRRHFHRGRRGQERRSADRRGPQQQAQPSEQTARGDQVEVEQIMREIRARIAQQHGIELTDQQVQELAARRLESILDPRTIKPQLLEQLRRTAGARPDTISKADRSEPPYTFEDITLYESTSAVVRVLRKLLNPILKLFFNPNPLIRALHIQARLNVEALQREADRDKRQAEWNALHYELLQRLVLEISRISLEVQSATLRVESLAAKVDFNERRVRGLEAAMHQARPGGARERDGREREGRERETREREREATPLVPAAPEPPAGPEPAVAEATPIEAPRRRRRRRRGRRGGGGEAALTPGAPTEAGGVDDVEDADVEGGDLVEAVTTEGEQMEEPPSSQEASAPRGDGADLTDGVTEIVEGVTGFTSAAEPRPHREEPAAPRTAPTVGAPAAAAAEPPPEIAPERVTPQLQSADPSIREDSAPDVVIPPAAALDSDTDEPR